MLSWALVEKHPVRLVERFETNPVVLVELLVFHHQYVFVAVKSPEPLGLFRVNYGIVLPLPQAKVCQTLESVRLIIIFDCVFVVQFWKED